MSAERRTPMNADSTKVVLFRWRTKAARTDDEKQFDLAKYAQRVRCCHAKRDWRWGAVLGRRGWYGASLLLHEVGWEVGGNALSSWLAM